MRDATMTKTRRAGSIPPKVVAVVALFLGSVYGIAHGWNQTEKVAAEEELATLIRDLGNPSYPARANATRRLCEIGMQAYQPLTQAAHGKDAEVALRAKQLLTMLDRVFFARMDLSLSFSSSRVAWDKPVDLVVTMVNRSRFLSRIPFETNPDGRRASEPDARQVGHILDIADWLRVRDPQGKDVSLHVDDFAPDSPVGRAIARRIKQAPFSVVTPGETVTITLKKFNRGWARYRLLEQGKYTVRFDYEPPWEDKVLRDQHVGRVSSEETGLTIKRSAPEAVSRREVEASLTIKQEHGVLLAHLMNRADLPIFVNKNFGAYVPFAQGEWVYTSKETLRKVPSLTKPSTQSADFDRDLLVQLSPGASVELARIGVGELRRRLTAAGIEVDQSPWAVYFSYSNLLDQRWQSRQRVQRNDQDDTPAILRAPLPSRIVTTRYFSNHLASPQSQ